MRTVAMTGSDFGLSEAVNEAIERAHRDGVLTHASLMIAGPAGGYLDAAKKIVVCHHLLENVIFTGPLYGKEKASAYSSADIYVLPSRYEIFRIRS